MKRQKLEIIDAYIFAKKMNVLSSKLCEQNNGKYINDFVLFTKNLSNGFLKKCEEKINRTNIYDDSFLHLRSELRTIQINSLSNEKKLHLLCCMAENIKNYDHVFN